jgi:membrane-associated progesterone receptor component
MAKQLEALRGWEERFEEKYLVVGKLVPVGSPEAEGAQTLEDLRSQRK